MQELETDIMAYLGVMLLQWVRLCGNLTLVQLHNLTKDVLTHKCVYKDSGPQSQALVPP